VPARDATANSPQPLLTGMNAFLKDLQITFRRDPSNHRPRINKLLSVKDKEQKLAGTFFYLDAGDDDDEPAVESKADKKKRERKEAEEKKDADRDEKRAKEKAKNRADDTED
jgi:ATP-binding cassette subfamily E protein 1